MDINTVREEIAAALEQEDWSTYPFVPADAELPAVVVGFPELINYHKSLKAVEFQLKVLVMVPRTDEVEAQMALGDAISPDGLPATIEAASGSWRSLKVETAGALQDVTLGDNRMALATELTLTIEGS